MTDYKDTLNLPKTAFEMRAGLAAKEPQILKRWDTLKLYESIEKSRAACPKFVLHDGPPYANGTLHHGHILNKVLKDIVIKDRTMAGFYVPYVPGWDCHGLPIEVQVDKELGAKKAEMSKGALHTAYRAHAQRFVELQRDSFKRLGVLGRWQDPYLTMNKAYEAAILREFARLWQSGLVYKGLRPVNWCTVHQTALAEAEVEYEDHISPSAYVAFEVRKSPSDVAMPDKCDLVIWTTTPWTLPGNEAVAVHPDFEYIGLRDGERVRIVAKERAAAFLAAVGRPELKPQDVVGTWPGKTLEGMTYVHPFSGKECIVGLADYVTLEAGTGCVHCAPGHGADDFGFGNRYKLDIASIINDKGELGECAGPFAGKHALAANPQIMAYLQERGALLNDATSTVNHRYPHCWRCHKPIIIRVTAQWFVAMDKPFAQGPSLRERAMRAIDEVNWLPSWGKDRIGGMLRARPDWCLSRQRTWGVPIAIVYCTDCSQPHVQAALLEKVAQVFEKEGAAAWFERSIESMLGDNLKCGHCGGKTFRKETDILDVWFDSGCSFAAVIEREGAGHASGAPVDLYLEGSDQHRGWFHSSLLISLATRERAPYRAVLTHGFVVDGNGKKISKSKGNYLDPFAAIDKDGAELLRLWVASEDYRNDIRLSKEILTRLADSYRKVRNTLRYLLGNLHDFAPDRDLVPYEQLLEIDAYALSLMHRMVTQSRAAYDSYNYHGVMQQVVELCGVDLSAFYLDLLKDRLYAAGTKSVARRSAQTVLYVIARDLLRLLAPIFCFTAEEAFTQLPRTASDPDSIHLAYYPGAHESAALQTLRRSAQARAEELIETYAVVRETRKHVNGALEEARRQKAIGSSTEASVTLHMPKDQHAQLERWSASQLADFLIVSEAACVVSSGPLRVEVGRAAGTKCSRCWLYRREVGTLPQHPALCQRCVEALG